MRLKRAVGEARRAAGEASTTQTFAKKVHAHHHLHIPHLQLLQHLRPLHRIEL
jgi:hypothetical protein